MVWKKAQVPARGPLVVTLELAQRQHAVPAGNQIPCDLSAPRLHVPLLIHCTFMIWLLKCLLRASYSHLPHSNVLLFWPKVFQLPVPSSSHHLVPHLSLQVTCRDQSLETHSVAPRHIKTLPLCPQPPWYLQALGVLPVSSYSIAHLLTSSQMPRYTKCFPCPRISSDLLCKAPVSQIHIRASLLQFRKSLTRVRVFLSAHVPINLLTQV